MEEDKPDQDLAANPALACEDQDGEVVSSAATSSTASPGAVPNAEVSCAEPAPQIHHNKPFTLRIFGRRYF
uniref:Uncharacterized protein n=1 Tax=Knipowitschia caucasica TaxID=637954 RepID=A0AAV2KV36_KNICA